MYQTGDGYLTSMVSSLGTSPVPIRTQYGPSNEAALISIDSVSQNQCKAFISSTSHDSPSSPGSDPVQLQWCSVTFPICHDGNWSGKQPTKYAANSYWSILCLYSISCSQ